MLIFKFVVGLLDWFFVTGLGIGLSVKVLGNRMLLLKGCYEEAIEVIRPASQASIDDAIKANSIHDLAGFDAIDTAERQPWIIPMQAVSCTEKAVYPPDAKSFP